MRLVLVLGFLNCSEGLAALSMGAPSATLLPLTLSFGVALLVAIGVTSSISMSSARIQYYV